MERPLLTLELARRIEMAEAQAAIEGAQALRRLRPDSGATVERIAGGAAVFCGVNSPITQAVGIGLAGAVSEEEMKLLEEFYFSRGDAVRVELCPLADPSVMELFGKRGYRVTEFSNVLVRPLAPGERRHAPSDGIAIARIQPQEAGLWTRTVAQGFSEQFPVTPELLEVLEVFAQSAGGECYLARVNGEVAGGATLGLRNGVGGLFGASTLPEFRNRGVQTALLRARLDRAAEAGCDIAASIAQPGSISHRNIERQGFYALYTRAKFERAIGT